MITFVGRFPSSKNIKDGMIQRIHSIDELAKNKYRIYLEISFRRNIKKIIIEDEKVRVYKLNYFMHRKIIKEVISNSSNIYIHSIYNYRRIRMCRNQIKDKNVTLDLHGVVPEEIEFSGKKFWAKVYSELEKEVCELSDKIIFVTKSMENHFKSKYKDIKFKSIIYPIISKNEVRANVKHNLKEELNIKEDDIVIIYSGNCQKWQNTDEMLEAIKQCNNNRYKFIILTGELEKMKSKIEKLNISNKIILKSVLPEELDSYYELAHYGFVLRDNHILNKVACPTKLIEYMSKGIIPIVKSTDIGDFNDYKYEFITIDTLNSKLERKKSMKNMEIINEIKRIVSNTEVI